MKLYFGGGETGSHRKLLEENGAHDISLSYIGLRRKAFKRPWKLADHFEPESNILIDSGAYSLNKKKPDELVNVKGAEPELIPVTEAAEVLSAGYLAFAKLNINRAELVTEFDATVLGSDWLGVMREEYYREFGDKFMPIWHGADGLDDLDLLASQYKHVGISQDTMNTDLTSHLNALVVRYGVLLHGVSMTKMAAMKAIRWDSVGSTSWISPSQYGDTFVWDGNQMHRYPKDQKDKARTRHRSFFQENGFDTDLIDEDDTKELLRLSVWSWQQYVESVNVRPQRRGRPRSVTSQGPEAPPRNRETAPGGVADHPPETTNAIAIPEVRERILLPIVGVDIQELTNEDGEDFAEPVNVAPAKSLMQCNTCYVKEICPKRQDGAECAYELPVYCATPNQMRTLINVMTQMQTQRVLRMSMIEQFEGGHVNGNTGPEFDRLARWIKLRVDYAADDSSISINMKGSAATGYVSSLLGHEVAQRVSGLPETRKTSEVMALLEAEAIEDSNSDD